MKALTIWQPWATLIVEGCKPFEFRQREYSPVPRALIGQRIVIHAGSRSPQPIELEQLADPDRARLLASCGFVPGAADTEKQLLKALDIITAAQRGELQLTLGAGIGTVLLDSPIRSRDLFATAIDVEQIDPNSWAIPVLDPELWEKPIPAIGQRGFWDWSGDTAGENAGHICHAIGCTTPVPPRMLMCGRHWRMVPKDLQRDVWREYRPGQEIDKRPSDPYLVAARTAIRAVAEREGRQSELAL